MKNTDNEIKSIKLSGYSDPCKNENYQQTMDYQVHQVKTEPQESEEYHQEFYKETIQNIKSNNEENVSEINLYQQPNLEQSQNNGVCLPNQVPSPNSKQCEKCGFIWNSMNKISEHINTCPQSTTALHNITNSHHNYNMLLKDEIIKTETEILDLNLYEVKVLHVEENIIQFEPNQTKQQLNQPNENSPVDKFNQNQEELDRIDEHSSSAKNISKSNNTTNIKNYCTTCEKSFLFPSHLRRHYKSISHKDAVKQSSLPDGDIVLKTTNNSKLIIADDTLISSEFKAIDGEKKTFSCSLCGKGFIRNCDMIKHKFIHKCKKQHKCDQCPKQVAKKSHLAISGSHDYHIPPLLPKTNPLIYHYIPIPNSPPQSFFLIYTDPNI